MKNKEYFFNFSEAYLEKFFPKRRIKSKAEIIEILMETIRYMLLNPEILEENSAGTIILRIDKMSRLFFISKYKYYSIIFPFFVVFQENKYNFSFKNMIEIDTFLISNIISIIKCDDFKANCSLDFVSPICDYEDNCDENFWLFLRELLLMEDGYIRYDYDENNQDEHSHPLNHYDIFYSNSTTFKIGLKDRLSKEEFIDLLNVNTNCKYLMKN
jgi:hypothetical protein